MPSDWATPIVPVPKKDGTFRIFGDYKVIVNPAMDQYPLPELEDIFATLAGGTTFSKIDFHKPTNSCCWIMTLCNIWQSTLIKAYTDISTLHLELPWHLLYSKE